MFRPIRRDAKTATTEETLAILKEGRYCVLALAGDDGYPYAVAVNYVIDEGKLYFHGASVGHKPEAIARNDKCSFLVVTQDTVVPEKLTTDYSSAHGFGRVREVTDEARKREQLKKLVAEQAPEACELLDVDAYIDERMARVKVFEISIEQLTGKRGMAQHKALPHSRPRSEQNPT